MWASLLRSLAVKERELMEQLLEGVSAGGFILLKGRNLGMFVGIDLLGQWRAMG